MLQGSDMRDVVIYDESPLVDAVARRLGVPVAARLRRGAAFDPAIGSFVHTPAPLLSSWSEAQLLDAKVPNRGVVLAGDRDGLAGVFALREAMRSPNTRRVVMTVAGESRLLKHLWTAGTLDGVDPSEEAFLDWEIVLYRHSARVITPSLIAARLLERFGIRTGVEVVDIGDGEGALSEVSPGAAIWIPEPWSRRTQTARILRALSDLPPEVTLTLSSEAESDVIWKGTSREVSLPLIESLGGRVSIGREAPARVSLVVLGDPFALPPPRVGQLRRRGVPVAVYEGSTAAALWRDAPTWGNEEDLRRLGAGIAVHPARPSAAPVPDLRSRVVGVSDETRARSVSVGIPVFRGIRFLEECVGSVLAQTQPVVEVLLVDDGSNSVEVDEALRTWQVREPQLIRTLRQPNRGVCVARNAMLDAMRGDAFLLVDSDDVLEPAFVERTAEALRANPRIDAVATWTRFVGDYQGIEAKPPFDERVGRRENPIISTCALVDMAVRDRGIRFDPELAFIYCEDWDFWAQIVAGGGTIGLVPEPLVNHRVHSSSGASARTEAALRIGRARAVSRLISGPQVLPPRTGPQPR